MMRRQPSRSEPRAQTLPDFAVGIAVFLLTLVFVSVFVPQLLVPFENQDQPVVAERIASDLSNQYLTDPDSTSHLNESSTEAFLLNQSEDEALEQFGVDTWYSLNVTIRNAPSRTSASNIRCHDPGAEPWITSCDVGTDRLALGQSVPRDDRSVATVQRGLVLDAGDDNTEYVILEVSVW